MKNDTNLSLNQYVFEIIDEALPIGITEDKTLLLPSYTSAPNFKSAIDAFLKKERKRFVPSLYGSSWRTLKNSNEARLAVEFDDLQEGYPFILNFRVFEIFSI